MIDFKELDKITNNVKVLNNEVLNSLILFIRAVNNSNITNQQKIFFNVHTKTIIDDYFNAVINCFNVEELEKIELEISSRFDKLYDLFDFYYNSNNLDKNDQLIKRK